MSIEQVIRFIKKMHRKFVRGGNGSQILKSEIEKVL